MQNAAFRAAGMDAAYVALDVPPVRLEAALASLHEEGFQGLNVTLPHKEAAFRLLAAATEAARIAGAANTLRRIEGGWEGDATDGAGFIAWLDALGLPSRGARALIVGAGGAARSVAVALAGRGAAAIEIVNRTRERAESLAAAVRSAAAPETLVSVGAWSGPGAGKGAPAPGRWNFLVRAVSSEEVSAEERRWWEGLGERGRVLDLNYGPRARRARAEAERAGLAFEDGLTLLLEQGVLSFQFWTGQRAPRDAMLAAIASESM